MIGALVLEKILSKIPFIVIKRSTWHAAYLRAYHLSSHLSSRFSVSNPRAILVFRIRRIIVWHNTQHAAQTPVVRAIRKYKKGALYSVCQEEGN